MVLYGHSAGLVDGPDNTGKSHSHVLQFWHIYWLLQLAVLHTSTHFKWMLPPLAMLPMSPSSSQALSPLTLGAIAVSPLSTFLNANVQPSTSIGTFQGLQYTLMSLMPTCLHGLTGLGFLVSCALGEFCDFCLIQCILMFSVSLSAMSTSISMHELFPCPVDASVWPLRQSVSLMLHFASLTLRYD